MDVLRAHRAQQEKDREEWGGAWVGTGRVFTREDGSWLHPANVTRRFTALCEEIDLLPVRLRDLRTGAATLMHASGGDVHYIKSTLGHGSHHFTSDVYANLLPQVDKVIAEKAIGLVPIGAVRTAGHAAGTQTAPGTKSEAAVRTGHPGS